MWKNWWTMAPAAVSLLGSIYENDYLVLINVITELFFSLVSHVFMFFIVTPGSRHLLKKCTMQDKWALICQFLYSLHLPHHNQAFYTKRNPSHVLASFLACYSFFFFFLNSRKYSFIHCLTVFSGPPFLLQSKTICVYRITRTLLK